MPHLATFLTYREHMNDVQPFRREKLREESMRKIAFEVQKPTEEELKLAQKRAEVFKRTIDALDEYSQTKTEDVESVTQTFLGEAMAVLTTMGVGLGKIFQSTDMGEKLTQKIAQKMGALKKAAPHVIPSASGLLFAIVASLPILKAMMTIDVQTPRIARFETLKGELSHTNDFAILTDEQIEQAKNEAKNISIPNPKTTEKSLISSLNILGQTKSYLDIVAKRAIYKKDREDFELTKTKKAQAAKNLTFTDKEIQTAKETQEIAQRLVHKLDLESQDYIERVFKILDVTSMCLFGFGVVGYWGVEKLMKMCKISDGAFKKFFPFASALAGVIVLNSKVAEYRNNAIRIARHKEMTKLLQDPTNFLKTPDVKVDTQNIKIDAPQKKNLFAFLKEFAKDRDDYEIYTKTKMQEDKKFKLAVRNLKLTDAQKAQAKANQMNLFKAINIADKNKEKFEERYEIIVTLLSTPMGLIATTLGNAFGYALHSLKKAPKSQIPLYSIIGTVAGLIPAIAIELYTTIQTRNASRVGYMQAQKDLNDYKQFLDYSKVKLEDNPFLKLSFKNDNKTFAAFK